MRFSRPVLYARPVSSIAIPVTRHKVIKERAIRGRKITRKGRMDKHLPTELATRMEAVKLLRPKHLKPTHLFSPTLQSPSNRSYSSSALRPIFKMPFFWSRRGS